MVAALTAPSANAAPAPEKATPKAPAVFTSISRRDSPSADMTTLGGKRLSQNQREKAQVELQRPHLRVRGNAGVGENAEAATKARARTKQRMVEDENLLEFNKTKEENAPLGGVRIFPLGEKS